MSENKTDFERLCENEELLRRSIDPEILDFLKKINFEYHVPTYTSCQGHIDIGPPIVGLDIPVDDAVFFYSAIIEIYGSPVETTSFCRLINQRIYLEQFENEVLRISLVKSMRSHHIWKHDKRYEVLFVSKGIPPSEDRLQENRRIFYAQVEKTVKKYLEYLQTRKIPPNIYRMMGNCESYLDSNENSAEALFLPFK